MIPKILPADKVTLVEEGYYQEVPADAKARDNAGNLRTREYHSPLRGHATMRYEILATGPGFVGDGTWVQAMDKCMKEGDCQDASDITNGRAYPRRCCGEQTPVTFLRCPQARRLDEGRKGWCRSPSRAWEAVVLLVN